MAIITKDEFEARLTYQERMVLYGQFNRPIPGLTWFDLYGYLEEIDIDAAPIQLFLMVLVDEGFISEDRIPALLGI